MSENKETGLGMFYGTIFGPLKEKLPKPEKDEFLFYFKIENIGTVDGGYVNYDELLKRINENIRKYKHHKSLIITIKPIKDSRDKGMLKN